MKEEIELFISKIAKVIKDKNYLYCVCKKGYHYGFIEAAMRLQLKKQDSLFFAKHIRYRIPHTFIKSQFLHKGLYYAEKGFLLCFPYAFITELFGRNNTGYCRAEPQIQKLMEFGIHPSAASELLNGER